jgi:hypothetical protein
VPGDSSIQRLRFLANKSVAMTWRANCAALPIRSTNDSPVNPITTNPATIVNHVAWHAPWDAGQVLVQFGSIVCCECPTVLDLCEMKRVEQVPSREVNPQTIMGTAAFRRGAPLHEGVGNRAVCGLKLFQPGGEGLDEPDAGTEE